MSRLTYAAAAGFISRLLASFLTRSSRSMTALKWRLKAGQDNNLVAAWHVCRTALAAAIRHATMRRSPVIGR